MILAGPPGSGKTSVLRSLERTCPCSSLWVTPGDLAHADDVQEVFEVARLLGRVVVFLEDLDVVAESRDRCPLHATAIGQLLTELDGAPGDHPLFAIATTNRLSVLEEALRNRPGRFDVVLQLEGVPWGPPVLDAREAVACWAMAVGA